MCQGQTKRAWWTSTTKTKIANFISTKVHKQMSAHLGNNRTDVELLKHKFKQHNQVQMKHQDINTEEMRWRHLDLGERRGTHKEEGNKATQT